MASISLINSNKIRNRWGLDVHSLLHVLACEMSCSQLSKLRRDPCNPPHYDKK